MLVRARVHEDPDWIAPLPPGFWPSFELADRDDTDDPDHDHHPELPTMHLRAGAIVPVGPAMAYTDEKPLDPLTLLLALDESGRAQGRLYEDAGDGFGYREGDFLLTTYQAETRDETIYITIADTEGSRPRPQRAIRVRVFRQDGPTLFVEGRDGDELRLPIKTLAPA